jgi:solute carrier family 8 (sodium/calcium exchanger)
MFLYSIGLCKKLDKLSKRKDFKDFGEWRQSISNHMYWCAASTTDGDGDMMVAKWKILPQHITNVHKNPQCRLYPKCGHGRLRGAARNRLWLKPGMCILVLNL